MLYSKSRKQNEFGSNDGRQQQRQPPQSNNKNTDPKRVGGIENFQNKHRQADYPLLAALNISTVAGEACRKLGTVRPPGTYDAQGV